ncbi:MAG TPA: hypothetical protein DET46_16060 [Comamonadaceae bacterium]|nr:hypothetical protein [Comamonadaceae bacterium]
MRCALPTEPALLAELEAIFITRSAATWVAAFEAADIPCGPVNTVSEAMADPVLAARFVEHPEMPGLPLIPFPAQLAAGMRKIGEMPAPPALGQHTGPGAGRIGLRSRRRLPNWCATGVDAPARNRHGKQQQEGSQ